MNTTKPRCTKLFASLTAALALAGMGASARAATVAVTSCADDGSAGTLRQTAASMASGDTLDLSALECTDSMITLTQGEIVVAHNASLSGAANHPLTITSTGSRIFNSTSADAPVGYLQISNLNITGGSVQSNGDGAYGGCILAGGNVALVNASVSGCVASNANGPAEGGAIFAQSVTLTLSRVSDNVVNVFGNSVSARGGGIYAGSVSCTDSTLSGNMALTGVPGGYGQGGGAIVVGGDASFLRCTIDTNSADLGGGVMQFQFTGTPSISRFQDSTISGNSATIAFGGIDVFCPDCIPPVTQLVNSTVTLNAAPYGAAVGTNGALFADSSIIARNSAQNDGASTDVYAMELTGSDNLIQSVNVSTAPGVITVTDDPLLMPLANNGGPTLTHALTAASPAWCTGDNDAGLSTDQRGLPRVYDGKVDIGAFQTENSDEVFHGGF